MECKFCQKECKNKNSLINHERLCKFNPNKQKSNLEGVSGKNPWNRGLTAKTSDKVKRQSEKRKESISNGSYVPHRTPHTEEVKQAMSAAKRALYASGWEPTCGRCKKYDYESPVAGKIKVDGSWELKTAKHLDSIGVKWTRNRKRFNYIKPDGTQSTYQPDFWVEDWNSYLEVKGYETELDQCKWSQFPEKLIIWKAREIQNLEN